MKKDYKKFMISAIILIAGLILADIVTGFAGKTLISNMPEEITNPFSKINYVVNHIQSDVICIGSSRAEHHFVPVIMKKRFNDFFKKDYSVYNAGFDGTFIECSCCFIECILERCTPKLIILEVNDYEIGNDFKDRLIRLSPFYKQNKPVTQYLNSLDLKTRILMQSSLYRYNAKLLRILSSYITKKKTNDGYLPLFKVINVKQFDISKPNEWTKAIERPIESSEKTLRNVMRLCKEKGSKLIVTTSPIYGSNKTNSIISKICAEEDIPYIDMESSEYFNNHYELFQDAGHLNDTGAGKYTELFCERLKPIIESE